MKRSIVLSLILAAGSADPQLVLANEIVPNPVPPLYPCGDVNADGSVDVSDPVRILGYLFSGGPPPVCVGDPDGPIPMDGITTVAELENYSIGRLMDTLWELRQRKQDDLEQGGQFQDYFRRKIALVKAALRLDGVTVEDEPIDDAGSVTIANGGNEIVPDTVAQSSCADVNADGSVDVSDAVRILGYLFSGGAPPVCHVVPGDDHDHPIDMDPITTVGELENYSIRRLMDTLRDLRWRKQYDCDHDRKYQDYLCGKIRLVKAALRLKGVTWFGDESNDGCECK
jgi:hypothetical protein